MLVVGPTALVGVGRQDVQTPATVPVGRLLRNLVLPPVVRVALFDPAPGRPTLHHAFLIPLGSQLPRFLYWRPAADSLQTPQVIAVFDAPFKHIKIRDPS